MRNTDYTLSEDFKIIGTSLASVDAAWFDPKSLTDRIKELELALEWYGEQCRLARLIHSEGDKGRNAIAEDGGKRLLKYSTENEN